MRSQEDFLEHFPFYEPLVSLEPSIKERLYLVPTTHGEIYDPDFAPLPSRVDELPNIESWTRSYIISLIEILARKRPLAQIARSTHRFTYNGISKKVGTFRELPRIRRIHRSEPIEGVIELTAILQFKKRTRALVARFEGVDRKWICTEMELL